MKTLIQLVLLISITTAWAATKDPAIVWSGELSFTSNYVTGGISNTDNAPALQGGSTFTHVPTGLYFNIWSSNSNFYDPVGDQTAKIEVDYIVGISNQKGDFFYDAAFARYAYPGAGLQTYNEVFLTLSYKFLVSKIHYSENLFGSHLTGYSISGGILYEIPSDHILLKNLRIGLSMERDFYPQPVSPIYNNYIIGLYKRVGRYRVAFERTDTHGIDFGELSGQHYLMTVTAYFDSAGKGLTAINRKRDTNSNSY